MKWLPWRMVLVLGLIGLAGCAGELDPIGRDSIAPAANTSDDPSRVLSMTYTAQVAAVPPGAARLDVWLPMPSSDNRQTVDKLSVQTAQPHEILTEAEYGNTVLHVWSDRPSATTIAMSFHCLWREEHALGPEGPANVSRQPADFPRLLRPDRLGVIDDRIRSIADGIMAKQSTPLARARAAYDYVIDHMAYDKTAPGWGNGDTARACLVGKGNCTDFHALFISIARACNIPARFSIGLQIPKDSTGGDVKGYHCWAEFWVAGMGWVPVDASEGWKDPKRRDFYFGNLDDNRIRLSVGRDVRLPGMKGEPLNYFLSPYAEADGKKIAASFAATYTPDAAP
jgi:transglutaminase-like putative cysteine protease